MIFAGESGREKTVSDLLERVPLVPRGIPNSYVSTKWEGIAISYTVKKIDLMPNIYINI